LIVAALALIVLVHVGYYAVLMLRPDILGIETTVTRNDSGRDDVSVTVPELTTRERVFRLVMEIRAVMLVVLLSWRPAQSLSRLDD
jgi:cell division protein FtsL